MMKIKFAASFGLLLVGSLTALGCGGHLDTEEPSSVCSEGDTHDDGCNSCSCSAGQWLCTERACGETSCGARAGDTCGDNEYCAYQAGEYCGAADAQSTCQPRPEVCDTNYDPVCGCDSKTYSNACVAASAGTGVMTVGECQ